MKLTRKDKSLILLVVSVLVLIWFAYSLVSTIFFSTTFPRSDVGKMVESASDLKWFNVEKPLEVSHLKNKVILLDFWSYSCVSCVETVSEIKKLEEKFGSKLTVIAVHIGKFGSDRTENAVQKAILKYDINYPVINDPESKIAGQFGVKYAPSFVLINTHGDKYKSYEGMKDFSKLKKDVSSLVARYRFEINRDLLPIVLDKFSISGNVLMFPTHIEYAYDFSYKSKNSPVLFIANSGKDNIVVSSITGDMVVKIGSGQKGLQDGSFDVAMFNSPQGMAYAGGKLYVADRGNNAIREIDFKEGKVKTILGSGAKGGVIESNERYDSKDIKLSLPSDVEFYPSKSELAIANSGSNQILLFNLKNNQVRVFAGNGSQGIKDGKYPQNSLAQTSALSSYNGKLYFTDSASSSLRVVDESGDVKTLIGRDIAKFGHVNGGKAEALMQNPQGLLVDDTGAYVADSLNHRIRKYDFTSGQIRDLSGMGKVGSGVGSNSVTQYDEPIGIASIVDRLFVVDSNNNRVLVLNRGTLNTELLDIMPPLKFPKESFLEYLPNLQESPEVKVKSDFEVIVKIKVKSGWKINEMGPSFINLLEMVKERKANLIANFDWNNVASKEMKLPKLVDGKKYLLQGVIYYCEDKRNALCYVKSYEQSVVADSGDVAKEIVVELN